MSKLYVDAAASLETAGDRGFKAVVGFDGFIDEIIDVVAKRAAPDDYDAFATIADLGQRVVAAAGRSTNLELVVKQRKIGGNGPIMAQALLQAGHRVDYIGVLGQAQPDEVFSSLVERADEVISLGAAGQTDALEFTDGKLMLGKLTPLESICWPHLKAHIGIERLASMFVQADAVATVNWTMILAMTDIWQQLQQELIPMVRQQQPDWRPRWFVDLADPAKRDEADLRDALTVLTQLQRDVDVILGLNGSEACQVAAVLGETWQGDQESTAEAERIAAWIQQRLDLSCVMVHLVGSAAAAWHGGNAGVPGFHCAKPMITTGAGDHFNAGFFGALMAGCDYHHALVIGGASSGHYVRTAESPTRQQLITFLRDWSPLQHTADNS